MSRPEHIPVLLDESLEMLAVDRPGIYIDCTLGLGGHSLEILRRNPKAEIIGLDLDEQAIRIAQERLEPFGPRVTLYLSDYRNLPEIEVDFKRVRGVLADMGMSSFQLDTPERGFSHAVDGPLDMRMDLRGKTSAARILEKASEIKLAQIFRDYGELKQARPLARAIASARRLKPLESTTELRALVERVCHWIPQRGKIHPASKVFQALRIEVNNELAGLDVFLESTLRLLPPGGHLAAISFHSLEDRIVKRTFLKLADEEIAPPLIDILTRKPIVPSEAEVARNPRSRSAKLRAAERR
ncbi:MAG: 16S rRNA (cytosine(1402)-N(4))-methyltransferase RsmH [Acidobacteriota bacterium]|nr:16S rRNA (cytosine(1402)-N(4))-methyltransferase RsmH [Acidobacteriota bacterium]